MHTGRLHEVGTALAGAGNVQVWERRSCSRQEDAACYAVLDAPPHTRGIVSDITSVRSGIIESVFALLGVEHTPLGELAVLNAPAILW